MRFAALALLALIAATAVCANEAPEDRLNTDEEDESSVSFVQEAEDEMVDISRKIKATAKALGASGRYRAPAIVPRASMDEFARELARIKARLDRIVANLGPRIARSEKRVKDLRDKVTGEQANIDKLKKAIREHKRKARAEIKKKYAKEIAALKAKLAAYAKSRDWLEALKIKTDTLNGGKPGDKKYELALAEIKQSVADNSDIAENMLGDIDVVGELQNLETSRKFFDAAATTDLEVGSIKMYETTRLQHLIKRMGKALQKKTDDAKKKLKDIHKIIVPAHLHMGLRRAQANLKLYQKRLIEAKAKHARLDRTDIPKINAAKRELAKIVRIERHIYTAKGKK